MQRAPAMQRSPPPAIDSEVATQQEIDQHVHELHARLQELNQQLTVSQRSMLSLPSRKQRKVSRKECNQMDADISAEHAYYQVISPKSSRANSRVNSSAASPTKGLPATGAVSGEAVRVALEAALSRDQLTGEQWSTPNSDRGLMVSRCDSETAAGSLVPRQGPGGSKLLGMPALTVETTVQAGDAATDGPAHGEIEHPAAAAAGSAVVALSSCKEGSGCRAPAVTARLDDCFLQVSNQLVQAKLQLHTLQPTGKRSPSAVHIDGCVDQIEALLFEANSQVQAAGTQATDALRECNGQLSLSEASTRRLETELNRATCQLQQQMEACVQKQMEVFGQQMAADSELQSTKCAAAAVSATLQSKAQQLKDAEARIDQLERQLAKCTQQTVAAELRAAQLAATADEAKEQFEKQSQQAVLDAGRFEQEQGKVIHLQTELSKAELEVFGSEAFRAAEEAELVTARGQLLHAQLRASASEAQLGAATHDLEDAVATIEDLRKRLQQSAVVAQDTPAEAMPEQEGTVVPQEEEIERCNHDFRTEKFALLQASISLMAPKRCSSPVVLAARLREPVMCALTRCESVVDDRQPVVSAAERCESVVDARQCLRPAVLTAQRCGPSPEAVQHAMLEAYPARPPALPASPSALPESHDPRKVQELSPNRSRLQISESHSLRMTNRVQQALLESAAKVEATEEASIMLLQRLAAAVSPEARLAPQVSSTQHESRSSLNCRFDALKSKQESMIQRMGGTIVGSVKTLSRNRSSAALGT